MVSFMGLNQHFYSIIIRIIFSCAFWEVSRVSYFCQEKNPSLNGYFVSSCLFRKKLIPSLIFQIILRSKDRSPFPCLEFQVCVSSLLYAHRASSSPSLTVELPALLVSTGYLCFSGSIRCAFCPGPLYDVVMGNDFSFLFVFFFFSLLEKVIVPLFSLNGMS